MNVLIISSSLNPNSNSRKLAQTAFEEAKARGIAADYLDMSDYPLDICDGDESFTQANLEPIHVKISNVNAILLSGPVYTYGMAAATKNLVELTGRLWAGKPVGLMAAAGGMNSYMAVLSIANSLMLDYRCPIVPKYVYADPSGFDAQSGAVSEEISSRIVELLEITAHWGEVL